MPVTEHIMPRTKFRPLGKLVALQGVWSWLIRATVVPGGRPGIGTGVGEGRAPPLRLRFRLDYFSTQVSRRSTYWTGISL